MVLSKSNPSDEIEKLRSLVAYNEGLKVISRELYAAENIDDILINLKDRILSLFDAERITIYAVDHARREIYSKIKEGNEIKEIRLAINRSSIAGYCASTGKILCIRNAYDEKELYTYSPELRFDKSWDLKTGFITRQVLAAPFIYDRYLMGVIQLLNKKTGDNFTREDQQNIAEMADILGLTFYNQLKKTRKKPTKFDYLLTNNIISQHELDEAAIRARETKGDIIKILMNHYGISKQDIGKSLSDFYGVRFQEFDPKIKISPEIVKRLKVDFVKKSLWLPLKEEGNSLIVLIDDPHDLPKQDAVEQWVKFNYTKVKKITYWVSLAEDIIQFITTAVQPTKEITRGESAGLKVEQVDIQELIGELVEGVEVDTEAQEVFDEVKESDSKIVQLANKIIIDAYNSGVSDIHIEPYLGKKDTEIRFRRDGVCFKYLEVPPSHTNALISRLKIMARLRIEEKRLPQDGKIKMRYKGKDIELRVATVPTAGSNEDMVLRILSTNEPLSLDKMNFSERNLQVIKKLAERPYGLILCVGPTGSGKTTTLHSVLGYINREERKIWTAEDPVEITQYRLRQVQINPNIKTPDGHRYDFATAMRAFLRADPDVIMVGEMRDLETASIGIEASLTGHLVFSTLHTNSAPETIIRLIDMGLDPFNFADALLGILAQRLVRTICPECKESYHPSAKEFEAIAMEYGETDFEKLGIKYNNEFVLYRGRGCPACARSGLKGRTAIHELLEGTEEIKRLIVQKAPVAEIRKQAIAEGMTTLLQDGIKKVLKGDTTLEQVRRVCIK
ncbi:MAG: GspE/PulE family protein [Desulfobacterota bacterium]|nr:GspE/PulE family protein [Thermodesulfobacteriota bacterium]